MRGLKLGMLSWFLLLSCIPSFAAQETLKTLTVKAITHQTEKRGIYTIPGSPGSSSTNCSGNGTPDYGAGTSINMNCNTTTTPPTPPVKFYQGIVTDVVEGDGYRYTIRCTANWRGSLCAPLPDGAEFFAEVDAATMWIRTTTGKIKYRILDVRPSDTASSTPSRVVPTASAVPPDWDKAAVEEAWTNGIIAAKQAHQDYSEVIAASQLNFPGPMYYAMAKTGQPGEVAYWLAKHPAEAWAITVKTMHGPVSPGIYLEIELEIEKIAVSLTNHNGDKPANSVPKPVSPAPAASLQSSSPPSQILDEMHRPIIIFFKAKLHSWTLEDARSAMGNPVSHTGNSYSFRDSTSYYRSYELEFDSESKLLYRATITPSIHVTWETWKAAWGDSGMDRTMPEGVEFRLYPNLGIRVLLDKQKNVIDFGVY